LIPRLEEGEHGGNYHNAANCINHCHKDWVHSAHISPNVLVAKNGGLQSVILGVVLSMFK